VPDTFAALAAATILTGVVYALVMLPVAWRDPLGAYVRPRLAPLTSKIFRALPFGALALARLERAAVRRAP
jgi:hypothetical protein